MGSNLKVAVYQQHLDCGGVCSLVMHPWTSDHSSLQLTPGGKAAQAGVAVGDWVLNIDGENAGSLTHIEAQNKIRACGERLSLGLSRYRC